MKPDFRSRPALPTPRMSAVRVSTTLIAVAALAMVLLGCLGDGRALDDPALSDPELRSARVVELKLAIEEDHTTLQDLITEPRVEGAVSLHGDPQMRAIAERLTENQRALDRLEAAAAAAAK